MSKKPIPDLPRSELEHLIDEWIFNERNRKIVKRRLLDGICYEPLADEFDLTRQTVIKICQRCCDELISHI